ncbi:Uncharacterised protein [Mycobacteroides abscessus subsp. abscessus]|nr:Uncharacterised protein [Mycobacteroides abscessus subsp. abscessus]
MAGDLYDNMYLFLSKTKMARVNTSGVTIFTKKPDQSQIPAQVFEVFRLLDQRHTDEVAAYLLPHGMKAAQREQNQCRFRMAKLVLDQT